MGEKLPLRGDLAGNTSKLRRTLLRSASIEPELVDPLAIGSVLVNRDRMGDFTIERVNERKGKEPLVILRGPKGETVSRTKGDLERILREENGAWLYKNPPTPPKP